MKNLSARIITLGILSIFAGAGSAFLTNYLFETQETNALILSFLVFVLMSVGFFYIQLRADSRSPKAYDVAIIGFPASGKTTLLTATFGEIFEQRIGIDIELRGDSTIDRVNADLLKLARGQALGPTESQDRFAYRTRFRVRILSLFKYIKIYDTYKVEFGDFPGEDSQTYAEEYGDWLHTTPFFRWAADADAMIFIIDTGMYIRSLLTGDRRVYVSEMTTAIRTSWQHLLDLDEKNVAQVKNRPVALVFTKSDLWAHIPTEWPNFDQIDVATKSDIADKIDLDGFGEQVPGDHKLNSKNFLSGKATIENDFAGLIGYLEKSTNKLNIIHTSSFGLLDGRKLGVAELLSAVLPK